MKFDDPNITGDEPLECLAKVDLMKSMQWAAWIARSKIDEGFYSQGEVNEVRERKLFEHWYKGLTDEAA